MKGPSGALGYLVARTTVNRVMGQVRRLKRPRYVIALIFGLGYFYLIFGAPHRRPGLSGDASSVTSGILTGVAVMMVLSVLWMWLLGRNTSSLAFLPAEVQMLFPAPVSRRALVGYKVARTQLVVLLNAAIWTMLSGRFGIVAPGPQRFVAAWGIFTVLTLHPLGLALMRVAPVTPARKTFLLALRMLAIGILVAALSKIAPLLTRPSELGVISRLHDVSDVLAVPPLSYALAPFRALFAPFLATSLTGFASAFAVVLGIIVLHLVWVMSANVGFEEVAATASVKLATQRAAIRAFQSGGVAATPTSKTARDWLPLKPTGHPAMAIVWKNTLALVRTRMLFSFIVPVVVVVIMISMSNRGRGGGAEGAGLYLLVGLMLFTMGSRVLRNDLRQDMMSLASLKTLPLSGAMLVTAEIASPAILLSVLQVALLVAAYMKASADGALPPNVPGRSVLFVLLPLLVFAVNTTNVAIQNGIALIFPGWVRMGPSGGGIETMGQNMLMTFGSLFAFLLSFLLPSGAGTLAFFLTVSVFDASKAVGFSVAGTLALVLFVLQLMLMMQWFGRVFDKTEASALT